MRKKNIELYLYIGIFSLFLLVSFILPLYSFEGYQIIKHTTSHLGAQGSPHAWMMNLVFIGLGLLSFYKVSQTKFIYIQLFGSVFSISLMLTGIFRHAPLTDISHMNQLHDTLHSVFATSTGFSFVILLFGYGFMSQHKIRYLSWGLAMISTLLSYAMFQFPEVMGLLQRIMFIFAFLYLFFIMNPTRDINKKAYS